MSGEITLLSHRANALPNRVRRLLYKTIVLVVVVVPLAATLVAIRLLWQRAVHPLDLVLLAVMYALVAFGVTVGYHRMLTHRSFQPHPAVKVALLALGSMAVEGPAINWAATHIKHHARADREGDPHSPVDGFFHAHLGWIFGDGEADPAIYCRHLVHDRIVRAISRTFLIWAVLSLAIPFGVGFLFGGWSLAWTGLLWGGLVRLFLTHHVTWSVNSVCHTFGKRAYETPDRSRNEWVVGLLAFGEGWHNNHHAFPRSAFHGLRWWQLDVSGYLIWTLERLGLASEVYRVPSALMRRQQPSAPSDTIDSVRADEQSPSVASGI
jgi:stearoyl-CoA desaturase (Delta-9 desaturase)